MPRLRRPMDLEFTVPPPPAYGVDVECIWTGRRLVLHEVPTYQEARAIGRRLVRRREFARVVIVNPSGTDVLFLKRYHPEQEAFHAPAYRDDQPAGTCDHLPRAQSA